MIRTVCFFAALFTSLSAVPVFIGTNTGGGSKSKGIYLADFDVGTGRLAQAKLAAEYENPGFLAQHPEKPVLYACNVSESDLADYSANAYVAAVEKFAHEHHGAGTCVVSASVEAELIDFDDEEASEYLESLGVKDSGVSLLIRATYDLLGLASYFTAGVQEVRAWTFKKGMKAPQCAGVIHTDFESGFIKAEVVAYTDLIEAGNVAKAREAGKYRLEGKEYEFKDGDVTLFRFAN